MARSNTAICAAFSNACPVEADGPDSGSSIATRTGRFWTTGWAGAACCFGAGACWVVAGGFAVGGGDDTCVVWQALNRAAATTIDSPPSRQPFERVA
ncbi:hypothetical protein GCM10027396_20970 [Insolitispirillum peregrinum]